MKRVKGKGLNMHVITFALRNSPKKLSTTTTSFAPCLAVDDPDKLR